MEILYAAQSDECIGFKIIQVFIILYVSINYLRAVEYETILCFSILRAVSDSKFDLVGKVK